MSPDSFLNFLRRCMATDTAGRVLEQVVLGLETALPLDDTLLSRIGRSLAGEFFRLIRRDYDDIRAMPFVHPRVTQLILGATHERLSAGAPFSADGLIGEALAGQLREDISDDLRLGSDHAWGLTIGVGILASCDCMARLGLHHTNLSAIMSLYRHCGGWNPFRGVVVLIERPSWLFLDDQRRLHSHAGMALQYLDGWGVYAWHGVRVPEQVIRRPDTLTPERILHERNAEVRRVMIERFGLDRLLAAIPRKRCLDVDEGGRRRLYRLRLQDDEPIVAVRVRCPSTGQIYFLRVPPHVRTCRAG